MHLQGGEIFAHNRQEAVILDDNRVDACPADLLQNRQQLRELMLQNKGVQREVDAAAALMGNDDKILQRFKGYVFSPPSRIKRAQAAVYRISAGKDSGLYAVTVAAGSKELNW
jgi:hypothetical protein